MQHPRLRGWEVQGRGNNTIVKKMCKKVAQKEKGWENEKGMTNNTNTMLLCLFGYDHRMLHACHKGGVVAGSGFKSNVTSVSINLCAESIKALSETAIGSVATAEESVRSDGRVVVEVTSLICV